MENKVSIILPVYNVQKYIHKAVTSVLNQTHKDFELLIIDDGSPDDSIKIAQTFQDNRIKIFHKKNGGLSDARNYGLEKAKGEYVYFMDSDDWIEPELLRDSLEILFKENLDFLIFGYMQDDEDETGNFKNSQAFIPANKCLKKGKDRLQIDENLLGILGYAWNKLYRRSFLDQNNIHFEKGISLVEDILFNSKVYSISDKMRLVDKAYYHYLNRPVTTLIKQFHPDSFELKVKKSRSLELFFESWSVKNKEEFLAHSLVSGIKYCIYNLYAYDNGMSYTEKGNIIRQMFMHDRTTLLIPYFNAVGIKDIIFKTLISKKLYKPFNFLMSSRKKHYV